MTIRINGAVAVSGRFLAPGAGVWSFEASVDLGAAETPPEGRVTVTVGSDTLSGTVDPRRSGRMGTTARVLVVAGAGGWDKPVPALHLKNDLGVTSTAAFTAAAAAVGETVVDPAPRRLGADYVRTAGPASRVLRGVAWYLDAAGVTHIGKRPALPIAPDVSILEWDPLERRAVLAADRLVWPGTLLVDPRFGTGIVRDVEQNFTADGARVLAWCETGAIAEEEAGNRLARGLAALAAHAVGVVHLRRYAYRVVLQGADGRVTLQVVSREDRVPEMLRAVPVWAWPPGVSQILAPGTVVLVAFVAGDAAAPVVVGFDPNAPPAISTSVGGDVPLVLASPDLATWVAGVTAYVNGRAPGTLIPPTAHVATRAKGG
jgi:hypothetical protein